MMADVPNSYRDPYWSQLASNTEQKLGLPTGLLSSIVANGEKSNADQVSEAGARTPFQIIPATRKAAIGLYGIDPYLSPSNAAEVAGRLLQDSLKRNQGDVTAAVSEYHGGTDRSGWGPRTKAYVGRVLGALVPSANAAELPPVVASGGALSPSAIASIYSAYSSGKMSPDEVAQFEGDVKSGAISLPSGLAGGLAEQILNRNFGTPQAAQMVEQTAMAGANALSPGAAAATGAAPAAPAPQLAGGTMLPDGVVQAYTSGQMSVADRIELEHDVKSGVVKMPDGVQVHNTQAPGFLARLSESITGAQRRTPETDAAPDWATMPELNTLSAAGLKTGLGTLLSNPQETLQIIQANYPGVQARQDAKGNIFMRSSMDGKEYAIKPGFQLSDIPRAGAGLAAFTPAGKAVTLPGMALAAGGTQAVIEGSQALTGGNFDPGEVAMAAATGGLVPAAMRAGGAVWNAGSAALAKLRGVPAPAAAAREAAAVAPGAATMPDPAFDPNVRVAPEGIASTAQQGAAQVAPAAAVAEPVAPMAATDLAQTAKKAAEGGMGSKTATQTLADQAAPNAKTVEAAKRLGIEDYLQPDHVTTNQAYRELAQAVKSVPGSQARASELDGLEKVGQRADQLISDIGGTSDVSQLDSTVKRSLQATQSELDARASQLYADLRDTIPTTTRAPATNVLEFVQQRAKDLGGAKNLSPMEKRIVSKLAPKDVTVKEVVPGDPLMPGQSTDTTRMVRTQEHPTYALLDDVRKDVGAAARMRGPFKDADTGLAKKLYSLISDDQAAIVGKMGLSDTYNAARQAVAVRKGIEDDLVSLFGKQVDGSMVGDLSGAVRALPQGDASKMIKLLSSVPPDLRQEVAASGLASAFRTAGTRGPIGFGGFEKWYDGLLRNKQAHAAIMSNLPIEARKQISDLYRVSKGISAASRERISNGRIMAVTDQFKAADTLAGRLYEAAKRGAVGATVGTAAGAVMGPGVGAAVASALTRGAKPAADKAVDALIVSPEFIAAARASGTTGQTAAVRSFANSKVFSRFVRAIGSPHDLSDRERWILNAMQTDNNLDRKK